LSKGAGHAAYSKYKVEIVKLTSEVLTKGRMLLLAKEDYPNLGACFKNSEKPYRRRADNGQLVRVISTTKLAGTTKIQEEGEDGTYIKEMEDEPQNSQFNDELQTWKTNPGVDSGNIRNVDVIVNADDRIGTGGKTITAPVFIFNNLKSADWAAANLGVLAPLGILTSIAKGYFEEIRGYGPAEREETRDFLRPYNAHNDKFGFDFSATKKKLIAVRPDK